MTLAVGVEQVLAWRMSRNLLSPIGTTDVVGVASRLCGVQAQVASSAELAVRIRREKSQAGEVADALAKGDLIKTWAMRGTLHLLPPGEAGNFLSLMAASRLWERPSWEKYFGVGPDQIERLRGVVRDALVDRALTREELVEAVIAEGSLARVADALRSGWGTLLKPLSWQGDICHAPAEGNRVAFMRPEAVSPGWREVPDPDDAAPAAIISYLGAYGPATADEFGNWLAGGWFGKRRLRAWFDSLGDLLAEVEVAGERAFVPAEHVDELVAARPNADVRLLPGFDQYVLGPGTKDPHIIPPGRRPMVSKQSGWIAPVVVCGGLVSGTWEIDDGALRVSWFDELGKPPMRALGDESDRLSGIVGTTLVLEVAPTPG